MHRFAALIACCAVWAASSVIAAPPDLLEQRFDAQICPQEMSDWMKLMASEPNHVG